MQTVNGKLVTQEQTRLDVVNGRIESLSHQFEQLELKMVTLNHQGKKEYIQQLNSVKLSAQKLEQLYNRLLSATIFTAISLTILFLWFGSTHQSSPKKIQQIRHSLHQLNNPKSVV
jgi:TolA-binding protein